MATYYSPDLFLENIYLVVIYLSDGHITVVPEYDSKGRVHMSGDLIKLCRDTDSQGYEGETSPEPVIILGWGECEADAIKESRSYFRRLAKWHGHKEDLSKFQFLGHDFMQSEIFSNIQEESDTEEDQGDSVPICPRRKRSKEAEEPTQTKKRPRKQ
ncbi:Glutamate--tRNA ligase [Frankliniella fusca]|nr:Glutamate--tRNA ligase [Frankliniella fusca]KAK3929222.1 Glutamate--tRNA ligase [Frankliniella fusca]